MDHDYRRVDHPLERTERDPSRSTFVVHVAFPRLITRFHRIAMLGCLAGFMMAFSGCSKPEPPKTFTEQPVPARPQPAPPSPEKTPPAPEADTPVKAKPPLPEPRDEPPPSPTPKGAPPDESRADAGSAPSGRTSFPLEGVDESGSKDIRPAFSGRGEDRPLMSPAAAMSAARDLLRSARSESAKGHMDDACVAALEAFEVTSPHAATDPACAEQAKLAEQFLNGAGGRHQAEDVPTSFE